MPITRYQTHLKLRGEYESYMNLLEQSFNPATLERVMCRNLISIGWDGVIYDCDFNQMLDLQWRQPDKSGVYLWDITPEHLEYRAIQTGNHCFACTAGSGSSCTGALSA